MRGIIEQDLQSGMTPDQIRRRFVAEYGQRILLSPPKSGLNLVAWLGPALALLAGLAVAGSALRRWTAGNAGSSTSTMLATEPDLSAEDRALLQRALSDPAEVPDP
jgi:cytochrome c-type biogenesis protein CcmH/NrfF